MHDACVVPQDHVQLISPLDGDPITWFGNMLEQLFNQRFTLLRVHVVDVVYVRGDVQVLLTHSQTLEREIRRQQHLPSDHSIRASEPRGASTRAASWDLYP